MAAVALTLALQLFPVFPCGYPLAEHFLAGGLVEHSHGAVDGAVGKIFVICPAGDRRVGNLFQPASGTAANAVVADAASRLKVRIAPVIIVLSFMSVPPDCSCNKWNRILKLIT
ncbi:MAG: hypothetical protein V8R91_11210 [Butyricimonas faecihominis]